MTVELRPAVREDAADLVRLIDMAAEGLPHLLWSSLAGPGEDAWSVGQSRAERDEGAFSWRNATVAVDADRVAGALVGYPNRAAEPLDDLPPLLRPIVDLENQAVGSWYVNALAVYPPWRRRGVAAALMAEAERLARLAGCEAVSLIAADANLPALRFYAALGFERRDSRAMVKDGWQNESEHWLLLVRPVPVGPVPVGPVEG